MLPDKIAELCYNHYNILPKTGKPTIKQWTILSCIVKEDTNGNIEVVALGTGSKCIGQNKMSPKGDIINDSHAEIICRRAFLLYLYNELNNATIFNYDEKILKYALKSGIKFHFFTTHVPCGDAAIFPKENIEEFGIALKANNLKRNLDDTDTSNSNKFMKVDDIFRTGAKCLTNDSKCDSLIQGLEYHTLGAIRTKPGRGDPTLSVSCSDKFCKWSFLGIQGALLSLLISKPIYLSNFIVGGCTPYCEKALFRALYGRFDDIKLIDYKRNYMVLVQASKGFVHAKDDAKQPCPSSIIWYKGNEKVEIAVDGRKQGVTQKALQTKASRCKICKIELFRCFLNLIKSKQLHTIIRNQDFNKITYLEGKYCATDYQTAWKTLKNELFKIWTVKNNKLLQFCID